MGFPVSNNPLPGCQCKVLGRTIVFTKSTFNTFVDNFINYRNGLQITEVDKRIIVENNTGIQHRLRINGLLYPLHGIIKFLSPFFPYKRRHVPAGTMFRLQTTVEPVYGQLHKLLHETPVFIDLSSITEIRHDNKMYIPVKKVAPHDRTLIPEITDQFS